MKNRAGRNISDALTLPFVTVGRTFLHISLVLGGMIMLMIRMAKVLFPPDIDSREFWRNLYWMGNKSVLIVSLSAFFVGVTMAVQATVYVEAIGAYSLVGWGAGYIILRELGPVFVALMFSGRVGSNNTAELGTMVVTEQIDALRALGINPYSYLILPRVISMIFINIVLTVIGNGVAIAGSALTADSLMNIDLYVFWRGIDDYIYLWDMWLGLVKSVVFGFIIAISSCYWGLNVSGGAPGVGRAVYSSVVSSATGIFILNYYITFFFG